MCELGKTPRRISILGYPGADLVDITGPFEVFATASALALETGRPSPYEVEVLSITGDEIKTDSGLIIVPNRGITDYEGGDTILVAGGVGKFGAASDASTIDYLARWHPKIRRIGSICTGAFLLAEAGLLKGKRAVTHWRWCDRFEEMYPDIRLERDAIFIGDGNVYTTAGVTAGIDLSLALVEADCGRELAMAVAREMVVFVKRPGGQTQFSTQLATQAASRQPIQAVQNWIASNPDAEITVDILADRAGMSPRNFARVFKQEIGETPRTYVEKIRIERARLMLEEAGQSLERVASATGFASVEVLRRTFQRHFGVAPSTYAGRFGRPEQGVAQELEAE